MPGLFLAVVLQREAEDAVAGFYRCFAVGGGGGERGLDCVEGGRGGEVGCWLVSVWWVRGSGCGAGGAGRVVLLLSLVWMTEDVCSQPCAAFAELKVIAVTLLLTECERHVGRCCVLQDRVICLNARV